MTDTAPNRRRFLAMASAGTGLSIAGCNGLMDGGSDGDGEQPQLEGDERRATLIAQPDQQRLQEARQNVSEQVQAGELEQSQVQQALQDAQQQVFVDAVANLESELADRDVTVDDTKPEQAALLVSGPATALIDLLPVDGVSGLVDQATFEQAGQVGQGGTANATE